MNWLIVGRRFEDIILDYAMGIFSNRLLLEGQNKKDYKTERAGDLFEKTWAH